MQVKDLIECLELYPRDLKVVWTDMKEVKNVVGSVACDCVILSDEIEDEDEEEVSDVE